MAGSFYTHWRDVDLSEWKARWPNFHPSEIACRHCGALLVDEAFMDTLQRQRDESGQPIVITSAYRCPIWNAMIGGAPLSMHKRGKAGDQALRGRPLATVESEARASGFKGFGRYKTFLHADMGRARAWAS
jgi:uncharacterized protein YcbK (DUF882 family)